MAATGRVPLAAYSFFLTPSVYGGDGAYGGARADMHVAPPGQVQAAIF